MERKDRMDAFGALSLTGFAAFLAFNQIVIKLVNQGLQPVFFAGLRSAIAILCLGLWMWARGRPPRLERHFLGVGLLIGTAFATEFVFLFVALDLTTVTRTSVILYSMPVWLAIAAHFLLPGERIGPAKGAGLALAFAGVAWAILDRSSGQGQGQGQGSLAGDLCALVAAWGWAAIAVIARGTRLRAMRPDMQLFWQVLVSAPLLLAAAPFFGPLIRDLQPIHLAGLAFQGIVVVSAGFVFWLWLLSVYPAASVASFSFLTPIFGVGLGWAVLGEHVGPAILGAALLVAVGIILVNRPVSGRSRT
jgi:drug/metabolite transporter (DMT)-like permease